MSLKKEDNIGIIDIGSNTVRGVVFQHLTVGEGSVVFKSNILEQTSEGVLSCKGIESLIIKIRNCMIYFAENDAKKVYAFATSAMRDVTNFSEVYNAVYRATGVRIDLISGDKEAEYDYLALSGISESGIGIDLGGGSAQVVVFNKKGVQEAASFPIGVKRMTNTFCKNIIPTSEELVKIEADIKNRLSAITGSSNEVLFMGGTAKTVGAVLKKDSVSIHELDELYNMVCGNMSLLKKLFKKRHDVMAVGLKAMKFIAEALGADVITITHVGVRDGYVKAIWGNNNE